MWGVLWELTDEHVASLDVYEGVDRNVYAREGTQVERAGESFPALIYIATDDRHKAPSARYINALGFQPAVDTGLGRFAVERDYPTYVDQLVRQVLLTNPGERGVKIVFGVIYPPQGGAGWSREDHGATRGRKQHGRHASGYRCHARR